MNREAMAALSRGRQPNAIYFVAARREPSGDASQRIPPPRDAPEGLRPAANKITPNGSESRWPWASAHGIDDSGAGWMQAGLGDDGLFVVKIAVGIDVP